MNPGDALRMLRKLERSDLLYRLTFRFAAWAVSTFALWSLALLVAVGFDEGSPLWLSPGAFHATILGITGFLPAFMAAPFGTSSGMEALRRADRDSALESWLEAPRLHPAAGLLQRNAFVVLSIAAIAGFGRPRYPRPLRIALVVTGVAGLLAFTASQLLSVRLGYGVSLAYPDKSIVQTTVQRTMAPLEQPEYVLVPYDDRLESEADAPGARRYGEPGLRDQEALAEPDFTMAGRGDQETPTDNPVDELSPSDSGSRSGDAAQESRVTETRSASQGNTKGELTPGGEEPGFGDTTGRAKDPGYEGTGSALEASPLIDYRARFERQLSESLGTETSLGRSPSMEVVSGAIRSLYASFDIRVVVSQSKEPVLIRVEESWSRTFGQGIMP